MIEKHLLLHLQRDNLEVAKIRVILHQREKVAEAVLDHLPGAARDRQHLQVEDHQDLQVVA